MTIKDAIAHIPNHNSRRRMQKIDRERLTKMMGYDLLDLSLDRVKYKHLYHFSLIPGIGIRTTTHIFDVIKAKDPKNYQRIMNEKPKRVRKPSCTVTLELDEDEA